MGPAPGKTRDSRLLQQLCMHATESGVGAAHGPWLQCRSHAEQPCLSKIHGKVPATTMPTHPPGRSARGCPHPLPRPAQHAACLRSPTAPHGAAATGRRRRPAAGTDGEGEVGDQCGSGRGSVRAWQVNGASAWSRPAAETRLRQADQRGRIKAKAAGQAATSKGHPGLPHLSCTLHGCRTGGLDGQVQLCQAVHARQGTCHRPIGCPRLQRPLQHACGSGSAAATLGLQHRQQQARGGRQPGCDSPVQEPADKRGARGGDDLLDCTPTGCLCCQAALPARVQRSNQLQAVLYVKPRLGSSGQLGLQAIKKQLSTALCCTVEHSAHLAAVASTSWYCIFSGRPSHSCTTPSCSRGDKVSRVCRPVALGLQRPRLL